MKFFELMEVQKGSGRVPRHIVHEMFEKMSRGDPAGYEDAIFKES